MYTLYFNFSILIYLIDTLILIDTTLYHVSTLPTKLDITIKYFNLNFVNQIVIFKKDDSFSQETVFD